MCFAPSFYDDPHGTLCKLTQCGSVNDYLADFERPSSSTILFRVLFLKSAASSKLYNPSSFPKLPPLPNYKRLNSLKPNALTVPIFLTHKTLSLLSLYPLYSHYNLLLPQLSYPPLKSCPSNV